MPLYHSVGEISASLMTVRRPLSSMSSLGFILCWRPWSIHFSSGLKPDAMHTSFVELDPGTKVTSSVGGASKHHTHHLVQATSDIMSKPCALFHCELNESGLPTEKHSCGFGSLRYLVVTDFTCKHTVCFFLVFRNGELYSS